MSAHIAFFITVTLIIVSSFFRADSAKESRDCMMEKYNEAWEYAKTDRFGEAMRFSVESYEYALRCGDDDWKEKATVQFKQILSSMLNGNSTAVNNDDELIDIAASMADISGIGASKSKIGNVVLCGLLAWSGIAVLLLHWYLCQNSGDNATGKVKRGMMVVRSGRLMPTDISVCYKEVDLLCQDIFQNNCMRSMKTTYSTVRRFMDAYSADDEKLSGIESLINESYGGILEKIKLDFPNLKREDYLLFIYSCLGFSNLSIALFLNEEKVTAVYNRRKRLKKRMKESGSIYAEYYTEILTSGKFLGF